LVAAVTLDAAAYYRGDFATTYAYASSACKAKFGSLNSWMANYERPNVVRQLAQYHVGSVKVINLNGHDAGVQLTVLDDQNRNVFPGHPSTSKWVYQDHGWRSPYCDRLPPDESTTSASTTTTGSPPSTTTPVVDTRPATTIEPPPATVAPHLVSLCPPGSENVTGSPCDKLFTEHLYCMGNWANGHGSLENCPEYPPYGVTTQP
jgi:hypothetical protein